MFLSDYFYLYLAYGVAIGCWYLYARQRENKSDFPPPSLKRPGLEFAFGLIAACLTIGIGQLYLKGLLLPNFAQIGFITEAINQLLIFSPFGLLLVFRGQHLETAWYPKEGKLRSIGVGLLIALFALTIFLFAKGRTATFFKDLSFIYSYQNLPELVQVFAEDFAISLMLYRLMAWIGTQRAIIGIALLFAITHIPAMISKGVEIENFTGLVFDAGLGFLVLSFVAKSRNFLWFWMIHFAMDMTQFLL